jgi:hypothetical protein
MLIATGPLKANPSNGQRVRGASVPVNGADVRLGVDLPDLSSLASADIALVMGGYGRVRGDIPMWHLGRVLDTDGEPVGYQRVTGASLLRNPDQEEAFGRLPNQFKFKDAKGVYGKADQATTDFLKKCIATGLLKKIARGIYEKAVSFRQGCVGFSGQCARRVLPG